MLLGCLPLCSTVLLDLTPAGACIPVTHVSCTWCRNMPQACILPWNLCWAPSHQPPQRPHRCTPPLQVEAELAEVRAQMAALDSLADEAIAEYSEARRAIAAEGRRIMQVVLRPEHCLQFLRPGRLVQVKDGKVRLCRRLGGGMSGAQRAV
jgi:hypothetical protein